ncbi:MAG: methyl-accepting chemotaxis protein [Nitrospira sp.]|nr:methyl-accepting chemotaxis protein [Nitrospira sp.]
MALHNRLGKWSIRSWFHNFTILRRLMIGVSVAGVAMSLLLLIGLSGIDRLKNAAESLDSGPVAALAQLSMSGHNLALYQSALSGMGRYANRTEFADAVRKLEELQRQTFVSLDLYEKSVGRSSLFETLDGRHAAVLRQSLNDYFASAESAIRTMADGFDESVTDDERQTAKEVGLLAFSGDVAAKQRRVTVQLHELMIKIRESARDASENARREAEGYAKVLSVVWAGALMLTVGVGYAVARRVSRHIARLGDVAGEAVAGNLRLRARLEGEDDLGRLGKALNVLLERMASLSSAEEDRERLQQRLAHFQMVVADVRKGDMTKRGEGAADIMGDLVQEFNGLVQRFSQLLLHVRDSAERVSGSTAVMRDQADQLSRSAKRQAGQSLNVLEKVEQLVSSMRDMSENIRALTESEREALPAIEAGRIAVGEALRHLEGVRFSIGREIGRIRALGNRLTDIEQLVSSIQDIADQIKLLALNVTIKAAQGGEAGWHADVDPMVEQMRRLAERSLKTARNLAELTALAQGETKNIVDTLDGEEVERPRTSQAEDTLQLVSAAARRSSTFAGLIAATVTEQASIIDLIARFIKDVIEDTKAVQLAMDRMRETAEDLGKVAESMTASISRFTLA